MSSFTDTTGGSQVQAALAGYNALTLNVNTTLAWPPFATDGNYLAGLIDVSPTTAGLTLFLPDATLASLSAASVVNNKGAFAFTLADFAGNVVSVLQPSDVRFTYLIDVGSQAGLWSTVLFGRSNSAGDASQFAGPGLKAINNTLAFAPATTLVAGSATLDTSYRGKLVVWTGGTGALTLPTLSAAGNDFEFEFRNQGTGVCTLQTQNAESFDGSTAVSFQQNESAGVHSSTSSWYSVGRGRSTQFNFSQLTKSLAGGTATLSLTEASNVVQTYIGTLLSNQTVVLPQVVQVYYVSNQTAGAFSLTLKNPGSGTVLVVPQGQNMVVFSDGTNVINASTTTAGLSSLILAAGSAGAPAITIGSGGNGLFAPGTNQVGVAINGVATVQWDATGQQVKGPGAVIDLVQSATGVATDAVDGPAGQSRFFKLRTATKDRWALEAGTDAETGANAGSTLNVNAYDDNGNFLGVVLSVNRANRIAQWTFLPIAAGAQLMNISANQSVTNKVIDGRFNTVSNIDLNTMTSGVLPVSKGGTGGSTGTFAGTGNNNDITGFQQPITHHQDTTQLRDAVPTTGFTFYGNSGARFFGWDGTKYVANGDMQLSGNFTATGNVTAFSDERLKTAWMQLPHTFLSDLAQVKMGTFSRIDMEGPRQVGVSAQSLRRMLPEAVMENEDGTLSVNYGAAALAACVELAREVQQLRSKINKQQ